MILLQPSPVEEWILKPQDPCFFSSPFFWDFHNFLNMCLVNLSTQRLRSGHAERSGFRLFLQIRSALYIMSEAPLNPRRGKRERGEQRRPGRDMETPFFCLLYCGKALVYGPDVWIFPLWCSSFNKTNLGLKGMSHWTVRGTLTFIVTPLLNIFLCHN